MSEIAKPALDVVVMDDEVKFHPEKFKIHTDIGWKTFTIGIFLVNLVGTTNSGVLLWKKEKMRICEVAENIEEALVLCAKKNQQPTTNNFNLKQDEDALDTWFSSWLWPMSVFDGMLDETMKTSIIIIQT